MQGAIINSTDFNIRSYDTHKKCAQPTISSTDDDTIVNQESIKYWIDSIRHAVLKKNPSIDRRN